MNSSILLRSFISNLFDLGFDLSFYYGFFVLIASRSCQIISFRSDYLFDWIEFEVGLPFIWWFSALYVCIPAIFWLFLCFKWFEFFFVSSKGFTYGLLLVLLSKLLNFASFIYLNLKYWSFYSRLSFGYFLICSLNYFGW